MDNHVEQKKRHSGVRRNAVRRQNIAIIITTTIIVICCAVVVGKKHIARADEAWLQFQQQRSTPNEVVIKQLNEEPQTAEEVALSDLEYTRTGDSLAALTTKKPNYTWSDLETIVRNLTNEDYYASVWCVEMNTSRWVVMYSKDGETYFRHFNPEKRIDATKVRLTDDGNGKYHAAANKRDRYLYGSGGTLIHEVNGVVKETFFNHHLIDLFTPEPVPDEYDDWEDYYYDNEKDFKY